MNSSEDNNAAQEVSRILNGGDAYFDKIAYTYLLDFMNNTNKEEPAAYNFCVGAETVFSKEIENFPSELGKKNDDKTFYKTSNTPQRNAVEESDWQKIKAHCEQKIASFEDSEAPAHFKNVLLLSDYLGFSEQDKKAVTFLYALEQSSELANIMVHCCPTKDTIGPMIAHLHSDSGNLQRYSSAISEHGKFFQYGILSNSIYNIFPRVDTSLKSKLSKPDLKKEDVTDIILGKPTHSDLELSDFSYIGEELSFVEKLIKNAIKNKEAGVNILIYGPAGGGKTELSKTLAQQLGFSLYAIGEDSDQSASKKAVGVYDDEGEMVDSYIDPEQGGASSAQSRLADMLKAQALLSDADNTAILFDEIEDLLIKGSDSSKSADTESKIIINRLLETNAVPTIWCGNDPQKFHEAVRDRFVYSIYVDSPPIAVRHKIWESQLKLQEVSLKPEDVKELARTYNASPRKITKAIQAAKISGQGIDAIELTLPASAKITTGNRDDVLDGMVVGKYYDTEYSNIKDNTAPLSQLIERGQKRLPFSLMVTGPEGSGLKSLTRHLSEHMIMNPYEVSMVDLATPTQFSTPEQNIAGAFAMASDTKRFLSINDIEHLSINPNSSSAWDESPLVKTFVELAQHHSLPFAVTSTNNSERFPAAISSIFSNKIQTQHMTPDQMQNAFQRFFGQEAPEEINNLEKIVISDFSTVRKFLDRIDTTSTSAQDVISMLKNTSKSRTSEKQSIGFNTNNLANKNVEQVTQKKPAEFVPISQTLK